MKSVLNFVTHQRPGGREGEHGPRPVRPDEAGFDLLSLGGVVEGPPENKRKTQMLNSHIFFEEKKPKKCRDKTQALRLHKLQFGFICQRTTSSFKTWLCACVAFQISSKCTPPALLIPLSPLPASQLRKSKVLGKAKSVLEPDQRFVCSSVCVNREEEEEEETQERTRKFGISEICPPPPPPPPPFPKRVGGGLRRSDQKWEIHKPDTRLFNFNCFHNKIIFWFKPFGCYLSFFEEHNLNIRESCTVYSHLW